MSGLLNQELTNLGLNSYEIKVWLTLLSKGICSASEISELASVPRSRTYDVLESLERKGFIVMKITKPIRYQAVKPDVVIDILKSNVSEDLKNQTQVVNDVKDNDVLRYLNSVYNKEHDIVDVLKIVNTLDEDNYYKKVKELIKAADENVYFMSSVKQFYDLLDNTGGTIYVALKNNINVKAILDGEFDKTIADFLGISNVKFIKGFKPRFVVVDNQQVAFTIDKETKTQMWANSDFFSSAIKKLFEMTWEKNKKLENVMPKVLE